MLNKSNSHIPKYVQRPPVDLKKNIGVQCKRFPKIFKVYSYASSVVSSVARLGGFPPKWGTFYLIGQAKMFGVAFDNLSYILYYFVNPKCSMCKFILPVIQIG